MAANMGFEVPGLRELFATKDVWANQPSLISARFLQRGVIYKELVTSLDLH